MNHISTTDTSDLVEETGEIFENTKISAIENKINDHDHAEYTNTQEFNKPISENITARLPQTNLTRKNDIANFVKKTDCDDKLKDLNKKVTWNKTKYVLV